MSIQRIIPNNRLGVVGINMSLSRKILGRLSKKKPTIVFDFHNVLDGHNKSVVQKLLSILRKSCNIVILTFVGKLQRGFIIELQSWLDCSDLILVNHSKKLHHPSNKEWQKANKGDIIRALWKSAQRQPIIFVDDGIKNHECLNMAMGDIDTKVDNIQQVLFTEHLEEDRKNPADKKSIEWLVSFSKKEINTIINDWGSLVEKLNEFSHQ